jgi:hypothetical protein
VGQRGDFGSEINLKATREWNDLDFMIILKGY